jgi:hypothetical protein
VVVNLHAHEVRAGWAGFFIRKCGIVDKRILDSSAILIDFQSASRPSPFGCFENSVCIRAANYGVDEFLQIGNSKMSLWAVPQSPVLLMIG